MNSEAEVPFRVIHPKPRLDWLAKHREDILDPDLPIVDAHQHFYDHPGNVYLLDDLLADTSGGHNIVATVFMEAFWSHRQDGPVNLRPVGETEQAVLMAREAERRGAHTKICAAIVAHANLALGSAVEEVLAAHEAIGSDRLRGIRHIVARDASFIASFAEPPAFGLMGSSAFRSGFALLRKFNLSFDAWLYHPQLGELIDLARAFPDTKIVLNHIGGPLAIGAYRGQRHAVFAAWSESIKLLATCPNVHVKLGGMGMIHYGFDFHERPLPASSEQLSEAWKPYMHTVIETFGVDRCMFEANFPPDRATCSYVTIWNAFKRIAAGATAGEKRLLFQDTAARFYRL